VHDAAAKVPSTPWNTALASGHSAAHWLESSAPLPHAPAEPTKSKPSCAPATPGWLQTLTGGVGPIAQVPASLPPVPLLPALPEPGLVPLAAPLLVPALTEPLLAPLAAPRFAPVWAMPLVTEPLWPEPVVAVPVVLDPVAAPVAASEPPLPAPLLPPPAPADVTDPSGDEAPPHATSVGETRGARTALRRTRATRVALTA
jgi:hypothetical protein